VLGGIISMPTWAERMATSAADEAYWTSLMGSAKGQSKGKQKGSSKGYQGEGRGGKGKGASKGKVDGSKNGGGKGTNKAPNPGGGHQHVWWRCPVKQCTAHCGGKACWNRPMATECKVCLQPKGTAATAEKAESEQALAKLRKEVAANPDDPVARTNADDIEKMVKATRLECLYDMAQGNPTGLSKGAQRKLKKEATPVELRNAGFPAALALAPAAAAHPGGWPVGGMDSDEVEDLDDVADDEGWETSAEARETLKRLGMQAIVSVDTSTLYALPPPPPNGTIAQAVSRALAGEASEAIATQQKTVSDLCTAADAARVFGIQDELYKLAKKRLDAAKEALKLLTDKAPAVGSQSAVEKLKKAKQQWVVSVTDAAEGRARGKEKAQAKNKADLETIDQQINRLQALRQTVAKTFADTEAAFGKANKAREEWNKAISEGIDVRIGMVTPLGGEEVDEPGAEEPGEDGTTMNYDDLLLAVDGVSSEDIPTIDVEAATAEQKKVLEAMWAYFVTLRAAPIGMPTPPTTFLQMGAGHVRIAQTLVGAEIWRGLYGPTRTVQPSEFVPWQLINLLQCALEKAKSKITVSKEMADEASKAYADAKGSARDNGYCPF
jgi:hypothetical protein